MESCNKQESKEEVSNKWNMGDWAVDTIYDLALMETDSTWRTVLDSKQRGAPR